MTETFNSHKKRTYWWLWISLSLALGVGFIFLVWQKTQPPANFPTDAAVTIPRGLSASAIADLLKEKNVVRSAGVLYLTLIFSHNPESIQAGTYFFESPLTVSEVAERIMATGSTENLVSLTLPEGYTAREYAYLASLALPRFEIDTFLALTEGQEGHLFPDTYYLPEDFTAPELHQLLNETYVQKTKGLFDKPDGTTLNEQQVIILASLLEREANTEESMRMVSGILQRRLAIDMPLQADASLEYVLERPLNQLTADDLKINSPYNTYLYKGLPPTPIGNPGLQAIKAVLEPIISDYLFYITDNDGNFHYAKTFDEHRQNIAKYLR